MDIKRYFGLFNIKNHILEAIDNFNLDSSSLITNEEKDEASKKLINMVSKLSAAISLQPLPFADTLIITPIQINLVLKIAQIYNKDFDKRVLYEIVATIVKGFISRSLAKSIVKYIPIIGAPTYFTISYITTHSIGLTAIRVFKNKDNLSIDELKNNFEKEFNKSSNLNIFSEKSSNKKDENKEPVLKKSVQEIKKINSIVYLPSEN